MGCVRARLWVPLQHSDFRPRHSDVFRFLWCLGVVLVFEDNVDQICLNENNSRQSVLKSDRVKQYPWWP